MTDILKIFSPSLRKQRKKQKNNLSPMEQKQKLLYICHLPLKKRLSVLKKYYRHSPSYKKRWRYILFLKHLIAKHIKNEFLSLLRWILVDLLRGRNSRIWGIYQFVGLPGEGKTLSMVAHMERFIKQMDEKKKPYFIATNFHYIKQNHQIEHWTDIVKIAKDCYKNGISCLISLDEIHVTFDSSEWQSFPAEMLALLSFNRKYRLQFLCSSQIYERIPKKIRDIANFSIICKNILHLDRYFVNYYFEKNSYEAQFEGKSSKARFKRSFVAGDDLYSLYDTLAQVERMQEDAQKEKNLKKQAFDILFGKSEDGELLTTAIAT